MKNPWRSPLGQVLGLIHRPEGMMPCGNMRSCSKGGAHPLQHIEFRSKITITVAAGWPLRPLKHVEVLMEVQAPLLVAAGWPLRPLKPVA